MFAYVARLSSRHSQLGFTQWSFNRVQERTDFTSLYITWKGLVTNFWSLKIQISAHDYLIVPRSFNMEGTLLVKMIDTLIYYFSSYLWWSLGLFFFSFSIHLRTNNFVKYNNGIKRVIRNTRPNLLLLYSTAIKLLHQIAINVSFCSQFLYRPDQWQFTAWPEDQTLSSTALTYCLCHRTSYLAILKGKQTATCISLELDSLTFEGSKTR